jgi:hypothetical protein
MISRQKFIRQWLGQAMPEFNPFVIGDMAEAIALERPEITYADILYALQCMRDEGLVTSTPRESGKRTKWTRTRHPVDDHHHP